MTALAPVLGTGDLPLAELHAAKLDGELFVLDEWFSPVDSPPTEQSRAGALTLTLAEHGSLGRRVIAEQHTAAWVWGAIPAPPYPHQFCARGSTHTRAAAGGLGRVREVRIGDHDLVVRSGLTITTPRRTILDIVRFSSEFGATETTMVRRLLDLAGLTVADCREQLGALRNLSYKKRGLERLAALPDDRNQGRCIEV